MRVNSVAKDCSKGFEMYKLVVMFLPINSKSTNWLIADQIKEAGKCKIGSKIYGT